MKKEESSEIGREEAVERWRSRQEQDSGEEAVAGRRGPPEQGTGEEEPTASAITFSGRGPWGWGTLFATTLFGGWIAAGVVAGINWQRMGRPHLMWPTIILPIIALIVLYFVPLTEDQAIDWVIRGVIALAVAGGLWFWQSRTRLAWERTHPAARRAGWQIPVLTVIVALAIMIGLLFAAGGPATVAAVEHYNAGVELQGQGRYDEAIDEYTKAISLDPEQVLAYNNRGLAYSDLGQLERAIEDYDEAIRLDPNYAAAYYNRGLAYGNLGQLERAIEDYDEAIRLDPQFALAYNNRGVAYIQKGEVDQAIADFDKAIELAPEYAKAYGGRGLAYYLKGEVTEAISDLEKCIELSDDPALVAEAQQLLDELR